MLKDTEREKNEEVALQPVEPRKKWRCNTHVKLFGVAILACYKRIDGERQDWSYDPADWCHPVEYKGD